MIRKAIYILLIALPLFAKTGMKATNTFEVEQTPETVDTLNPSDTIPAITDTSDTLDLTPVDSMKLDIPASLDTFEVEGEDSVSSTYRNPTKAAIFSGIVPGMGQVYNDRYVKGTLFLVAEAAVIYYAVENHRDAETLWDSRDDMEEGSEPWLNAGIEYEDKRDNRNLLLWILTGLHLVNILDAYVDAHLSEFPEEMKKIPGSTPEGKGERCSLNPTFAPVLKPVGEGAYLGLEIRF